MLAEAIALREAEEGLRPFSLRRDLQALADLMEGAFATEMEMARSPVVAEMRRLAQAGPLLWLFDASYATLAPLLGGFVWIADGKLVGNVTLSPEGRHTGLWVISNVAVQGDYRGRGIARQLMEAALEEARRRGARNILLEVEAGNAAAQRLYRELGFQTYDTLTELSRSALTAPARQATTVPLRPRRPRDWRELGEFFRAVTPEGVQAVKPILPREYEMDIGMRLGRWLDDLLYRCQRRDWICECDGKISGVLQIMGQYERLAHRLQMDVLPAHRGALEDELLAAGLDRLRGFPERGVQATVSSSHAQALEAFQRAGFRTLRTLDQMRAR